MVQEVKIPIKDILEVSCKLHDASYKNFEFLLLRKFFIALLNLDVVSPYAFPDTVESFVKRIKAVRITYNLPNFDDSASDMDQYLWELKKYAIIKDKIYIKRTESYTPENYEIIFYKAFAEALLNIPSSEIMFSTVLANILGENVLCMEKEADRNPVPEPYCEEVNGAKITTWTGYSNFQLLSSLFKQLIFSCEIDEFKLANDILVCGFSNTSLNALKDEEVKEFIRRLNKEFRNYCLRQVFGEGPSDEVSKIEKLQLDMVKRFKKKTVWFRQFRFLSTSEELKGKIDEAL